MVDCNRVDSVPRRDYPRYAGNTDRCSWWYWTATASPMSSCYPRRETRPDCSRILDRTSSYRIHGLQPRWSASVRYQRSTPRSCRSRNRCPRCCTRFHALHLVSPRPPRPDPVARLDDLIWLPEDPTSPDPVLAPGVYSTFFFSRRHPPPTAINLISLSRSQWYFRCPGFHDVFLLPLSTALQYSSPYVTPLREKGSLLYHLE